MGGLTKTLFAFFLGAGGWGLLVLGIMDSSFLIMPLGNDILVIALTARSHGLMPYYAAMASIGSMLGVLLVDLAVRRGGEEGLEKHLSKRRLDYIKRKVDKSGGWAVGVACLMPPPFPFTPVILGAAALQYPRKKLLGIVLVTRMVRFSAEGALAIFFGKRILHLAESPWVRYAILGLFFLGVLGSVVSVYRWVKRSRRA